MSQGRIGGLGGGGDKVNRMASKPSFWLPYFILFIYFFRQLHSFCFCLVICICKLLQKNYLDFCQSINFDSFNSQSSSSTPGIFLYIYKSHIGEWASVFNIYIYIYQTQMKIRHIFKTTYILTNLSVYIYI